MCGKGGLIGGLAGAALGLFTGGATWLTALQGLSAGAAVGTSAVDVPETKKKQTAAIARAQTQQTALLEKQKTVTEQQRARADKRVAERVRSAAVAGRTKAPTGVATGVGGVQDAILRLGKTKLGGG